MEMHQKGSSYLWPSMFFIYFFYNELDFGPCFGVFFKYYYINRSVIINYFIKIFQGRKLFF